MSSTNSTTTAAAAPTTSTALCKTRVPSQPPMSAEAIITLVLGIAGILVAVLFGIWTLRAQSGNDRFEPNHWQARDLEGGVPVPTPAENQESGDGAEREEERETLASPSQPRQLNNAAGAQQGAVGLEQRNNMAEERPAEEGVDGGRPDDPAEPRPVHDPFLAGLD